MKELKFRTLYADEIDVRVAQCSEKGAQLLLYKDARCDMNILDETVTPFKWQRVHSRDNANCTVMIYNDETHDWIVKEDTGTESNTEAAKGLASDSFKRACVNWGIGRELYTSPFIWVKADCIQLKKNDRTGKMQTFDKFVVEKIAYDEKKNITGLAIKNVTMNKRAFVWQKVTA